MASIRQPDGVSIASSQIPRQEELKRSLGELDTNIHDLNDARKAKGATRSDKKNQLGSLPKLTRPVSKPEIKVFYDPEGGLSKPNSNSNRLKTVGVKVRKTRKPMGSKSENLVFLPSLGHAAKLNSRNDKKSIRA
ncbi:hypothetical protein DID77_00275 [Candidatus Marinamargulisbacteria bacterium SCGC AG-439-L15]|nr:hypothetical protein DID77_00275 [Candidatus Marinamargulisbacteria bacterium SCGC AG-439-L15]